MKDLIMDIPSVTVEIKTKSSTVIVTIGKPFAPDFAYYELRGTTNPTGVNWPRSFTSKMYNTRGVWRELWPTILTLYAVPFFTDGRQGDPIAPHVDVVDELSFDDCVHIQS